MQLPWKLTAFFGSDCGESSLHVVETTQLACTFTFWTWMLTDIVPIAKISKKNSYLVKGSVHIQILESKHKGLKFKLRNF